ncbi:hypothetical protein SY89_03525 [Halolamina pelagica]|uniref:Uncharacterized protein n=1 Tax=Halolamina pelagica TaxID=699431 RepID=A0A0P7G6U2_9EURY|nr:hypothetical protein SY89_03525 [Halolamina pelagica]
MAAALLVNSRDAGHVAGKADLGGLGRSLALRYLAVRILLNMAAGESRPAGRVLGFARLVGTAVGVALGLDALALGAAQFKGDLAGELSTGLAVELGDQRLDPVLEAWRSSAIVPPLLFQLIVVVVGPFDVEPPVLAGQTSMDIRACGVRCRCARPRSRRAPPRARPAHGQGEIPTVVGEDLGLEADSFFGHQVGLCSGRATAAAGSSECRGCPVVGNDQLASTRYSWLRCCPRAKTTLPSWMKVSNLWDRARVPAPLGPGARGGTRAFSLVVTSSISRPFLPRSEPAIFSPERPAI